MSPSLMPKLGKAGSLQSRQAIVHSLVHIESWAVDLSWVKTIVWIIIFFCLSENLGLMMVMFVNA